MSLSRRRFGAALLGGGSVVALAGCSGSFSAAVSTALGELPTWAQQLASVASGLASELPTIATVTGIPAATAAKITTIVSDVQSVASKVGTATTAAGTGLVAELEAAVNELVATAAPFIPGPVGVAVGAFAIAMPAIEAGAGMLMTFLSNDVLAFASQATVAAPPAAPGAAPVPPMRMTPAQAIAYLASLKK